MNESSGLLTTVGEPWQHLHIIERGALEDFVPSLPDGLTLRQAPEETSAELVQRVLRQVAASERARAPIDGATLVTACHIDADVTAARQLMLLGLAAYAEATDRLFEVLVLAPPQADGHTRAQLLGLVDELLSAAKRNIAVRLRFGPKGLAQATPPEPFLLHPALSA